MTTNAHYRTCNLCEAMCGIAISVEHGRITAIRGDEDDPFSRGHICPKAVALKDIHEDPDRLRRPLERTPSGWRELDWEEAFDRVAERLLEVQARHGKHAVAVYQGNPTVHNHGSMIHGQLFIRALGTKARYSATSVDQLPQMLASLEMFGHQLLLPVPDVDRTDYLLVLGANPLVSNGSLMSAPGIGRRLEALRARGGKVVVVDPRRTETADVADRHLFIRPGTDAFFLLGLLHELFHRGAAGLGALAQITDGRERLVELIRPYRPEAVAGPTGIAADQLRTIAAELSGARSAVAYGRVGICTQDFGGLTAWLLNVLNIVTGNLDRSGGAMFTRPAIDAVAGAARLGLSGHFARRRSRVRGLPEFGGEYPVATLAEDIEVPERDGGDAPTPRIRALVTSAGNPVLSAPNGRRLDRAFASLELMVSIDIYLNETTRHAHFILPPTFALEHPHYDLAFSLLTVRNTAKYSEALFERSPEARHDWEIFGELTARLELGRGPLKAVAPLAGRAFTRLRPEHVLDLGLRMSSHGLTLDKVRAAPHGLDLGPLEPCLPERLYTPDRRIRLVPELYVNDLARLEATLHPPAPGLVLIGRRELRSNNSWMHNSARLVKGKDRCTLEMNPQDLAQAGLTSGATVVITSEVGKVEAKVEATDRLMPGVVSLPHGWGHNREGTRLRVAEEHAGVSLNDLTDDQRVDALTGTASFSGVPVTVGASDRGGPLDPAGRPSYSPLP